MKLHTREQAPKEGEAKPAEKAKPMAQASPPFLDSLTNKQSSRLPN